MTVSGKGLVLLTYLLLEDQPVHRSTLAGLLWPQGSGLASLRVELSKLRAQGLDLSPERQPLLRVQAATDLGQLEDALGRGEVVSSGPLEGQPLEGLDRHTPPALQAWLCSQRERLEERRRQLRRRGAEAPAFPAGAGGRAGVPDLKDVPPPVRWLADRLRGDLEPVQARAAQAAQVLVYVGRSGSGRREALRVVLAAQRWPVTELDAVQDPRLLLTALLLQVRSRLSAAAQGRVMELLTQPLPQAELLSQLAALLLALNQPLVIVVHDADRVGEAGAALLEFALNWPLPLVLVLVTTPQREARLTQALGLHDNPARMHLTRVPLLPAAALHAGTGPPAPETERWHYQLVRHAEGWLSGLAPLLPACGELPTRIRLPETLRKRLLSELEHTLPEQGRQLAPLAGLPGPFCEDRASACLRMPPEAAARLLRDAVRAGVLERVPPVVEVRLPDFEVRPPDGAHPLAFRSELTRTALASSLDPRQREALRQERLPSWPDPPPLPPLGCGAAHPPPRAAPPERRSGCWRCPAATAWRWAASASACCDLARRATRRRSCGWCIPCLRARFPGMSGTVWTSTAAARTAGRWACVRQAASA